MKSRSYTKLVGILFLAVFISGCATIFKGSEADVRVNSSPAGATISVNGVNSGLTPQTLSLKRNQTHQIEFSRDGYESVRFNVDRKFDIATAVVGNLFSWSILGIIVDVATGAAYTLTPADLEANMTALQSMNLVPADLDGDESDIFVVMFTSDEWAKISEFSAKNSN